jgi:hypothetical protein
MEARKINEINREPLSYSEAVELFMSLGSHNIKNLQEVYNSLLVEIRDIKFWLKAFYWTILAAGIVATIAKEAHAERPPLDISNRQYHHPRQSVVVEERDGWKLCGLDKQCLAEIAADIGGDTRTLVFFKAPRSFYINACIGNELCYAGGPLTYLPRAINATYGWDESEGDVSRESVEDDFNFAANYDCQYLRRKAHNRIGRVAHPDECYKQLASQSRRECIRDLFSPRYSCGYHKGETKNQWSAFVVEKF